MPFVFRIYVAYAPWCLSLELLLFLLSIIGIIWHTCIQNFNISKRAFNWHIYLKIDPTLILIALKKILFRAFASCSTRSRCIQWVSYLYFFGIFLSFSESSAIHHSSCALSQVFITSPKQFLLCMVISRDLNFDIYIYIYFGCYLSQAKSTYTFQFVPQWMHISFT